jgi:two-component system, LuxR family, response regulator FixJ
VNGVIHIVDDDEAVGNSLQNLLEVKGYTAIAHTSSTEFLKEFKPEATLCIFADLRMPGIGGLELQEVLAKRGVDIPIIMITGFGDVPSAVQALKSGATDFIEKPLAAQMVLAAVERVSTARQKVMAQSHLIAEARQKLSHLTPRESEVLHLIIAGKPNKIIAFELGISQRTVENHRARLMIKTQTENVADLVKTAIAAGLSILDEVDIGQGTIE